MKRNKKRADIRVVYLKKLIFPFLCIVFILVLVLFSQTAVTSARKGLNLWFNIVFPSLFPFFVASELLNGTGLIKAAGVLLEPVMRPLFNIPGCGSFALAMGISSGYPVGARITSLLRKDSLITKTEAERLLTFTNNSGPLFIIGAISVGMLNMPQVGLLMLGCHMASAVTVGIIFRFYRKDRSKMKKSSRIRPNLKSRIYSELMNTGKVSGFGKAVGEAVKNSMMTMLAIGGYIVLFSVIIHMLIETGILKEIAQLLAILFAPLGLDAQIIQSVLCGIFEITTGTNMAAASGAELSVRLTACSMIIGWAGLSVHAQVSSIVSETDISLKPYFIGKFVQGLIAGMYTYMAFKMFGGRILGSMQTFAPSLINNKLEWFDFFLSSLKNLAFCFVFLAAASLALYAAIGFKKTSKKAGIKKQAI